MCTAPCRSRPWLWQPGTQGWRVLWVWDGSSLARRSEKSKDKRSERAQMRGRSRGGEEEETEIRLHARKHPQGDRTLVSILKGTEHSCPMSAASRKSRQRTRSLLRRPECLKLTFPHKVVLTRSFRVFWPFHKNSWGGKN